MHRTILPQLLLFFYLHQNFVLQNNAGSFRASLVLVGNHGNILQTIEVRQMTSGMGTEAKKSVNFASTFALMLKTMGVVSKLCVCIVSIS